MAQDKTEQKQAEEERRLWADAFEGCAHGIAIGDPDTNRILACNPAFARMHKCQVEDIVGSAILSLYAPPDHAHVRRSIEKADQIGHVRYEANMIRRDGSTFPVQMDVVSVPGEAGDLLYRVTTAQDITERKQTETALMENITQFRTLFEASPDAILLIDPHDKWSILDCNPVACQMNGYTYDELIGQPIDILNAQPLPSVALDEYLANIRQAGILRYETVHRRKDGTEFSIEVSTSLISLGGRDVLLGIDRDVTERKQAEEKVRKSEERYHYLFENNPHPMWVYDRKTLAFLDVNEAAVTNYGFSRQEFLNMTIVDIRPPEDVEQLMNNLAQPRQQLERSDGWRHRLKDGTIIDVEITSHTIEIEGHASALVIAQDITERVQAEENLRRFELLSEHSRDIILFMGSKDGRILEANAAAERTYGYSRAELLALTIRDLRASHTQGLTADQMVQADAGGILFETIHQRKDGTTFPVEVSSQGATISGVRTLISIVRDITERKQTQNALRLKDDLLHLTSEMAKVGGWEFDTQTLMGTWTDEVARIHDLEPSQETNVEFGLSFYASESRQKIEQALKEAIELGKPYDLELEMVSARGNHKWVRTAALPIWNNDKVIKIQGIFQDITERKQIEEELQKAHDELELKVQERTAALSESNALLQALMDYMPDQIYFKDTQSRFIRNSRSQANLLGLSDPAQAIGKTDFDFFPHAARSYAEEQEVMRSGKPLVDFEEWVVWPDGRETWVSTTKVPLRNSEGQTIGIFGISHDITERKRAEQAIRQLNADLEKQAAELQAANKELEAFSYSVSHDLRAPLRAIDGYTRILVEDYEAKSGRGGQRVCGVISAEARRMGQLIDDLLAFSRLGRKEIYSSKIDMKALAVSVLNELIKEEERERIDFRIGKLPAMSGDSSLIRQVWVNLLSNALKFTSKKERAVIEVGSKSSREELHLLRARYRRRFRHGIRRQAVWRLPKITQ